uniref:uncharacterized protein LOC114582367 isoform X1 n=1 Tax=Podarcis muralis TaxID=64176 RepID=UPI0010A04AA2|nr:uncharacterized protein LOC114582367 isoform X1 [Podarcis muralis]XP_028559162.1 uncharacterized protein LOC114582367 isoform X1 [Podarcis muralis]
MAAVVAGLARLLQPAMMFPGGEPGCRDLAPWYLLLGLRLVALFIADGPWSSPSPDLVCNWTSVEADSRPFCSALCFNRHFPAPVSSAWGFAFLAALLPVGLMGLIRTGSKHRRKAAKEGDEELTDITSVSHDMAAGSSMAPGTIPLPKMVPSESKMSPRCTWPSAAFVFCVFLLMATELGFFWVVIFLQIPSVLRTTFLCLPGAHSCPEALECALAGQADKHMALWTLAFTAVVNMAACLAYLLLTLGRAFRCHRGK